MKKRNDLIALAQKAASEGLKILEKKYKKCQIVPAKNVYFDFRYVVKLSSNQKQ